MTQSAEFRRHPNDRAAIHTLDVDLRRPLSHRACASIFAIWFICLAQTAVTSEPQQPRPPGMRPLGVTVQEDGTVPFTIASDRDRGWSAWWMFRLEDLQPGQTLRLQPRGRAQARAQLPVISEDDGRSWRHFDIRHPVTVNSRQAIFAWYVPYLLAHAETFAARQDELGERLRVRELCRSEQDRPVHLFEIGAPLTAGKPVIWVQARQHAWEVGSSWTAQGLMDWAVGDSPEAAELRSMATLLVVPLMDVDNVELGNGGKGQKPYDHNQGWTLEEPVWTSVRAAQAELRALVERRQLVLFFDLHDPGWGGPFEWWIGSLEDLAPDIRQRTQALADTFRQESATSIPFKGFKIVGEKGRNSRIWVARTTQRSVVGGTLEIGIAPPRDFTEPPPAQHLLLGAALGRSVVRWMNAQGGQR